MGKEAYPQCRNEIVNGLWALAYTFVLFLRRVVYLVYVIQHPENSGYNR